MSKREPKLYFADILLAIKKIEKYSSDLTFVKFSKDEKTVDAVVRNFEVLGEAVNNLSNDIKKNNTNLPWKKIVSMRNKVIHEYFGVDLEILWQTIKEDLPEFKSQIISIASSYYPNDLGLPIGDTSTMEEY
ncbi:MAG: hypothetical protein ACD_83C00046G0003 [uncultured bacterium]|uniref:DUF86 domain-containing protein n=1 Tax=Berkelbacteria bacterium GW2011_GWA2_38_9 TaxID=1618334 RepID=A0A0G0LGR2_9BACT|nr:MAG: hypothetical protein ACD_83C00046G0003 [uncultured bacterium]KKQ90257.1 MAG: hypothetical protein UT11_C0010G0019 [Berkelbacteria bacterium GW2011_GWA2_38_9]